jgi:cytidine deaminase
MNPQQQHHEQVSDAELSDACESAWLAAKSAYAPYSKFRVGAAVVGGKGIYSGSNVENASYSLSLCAERAALAAAVSAGDLEIRLLVLAFLDAEQLPPASPLVPCGACRQWLCELAPHAQVYVCNTKSWYAVADLLPLAFRFDSHSAT